MSDYERGLEIRREVLGDEHVDASLERANEHTREFQDFITRYAWGEIWTRPGLDRRTRSCITLTALVALGRFDELAAHIRAADSLRRPRARVRLHRRLRRLPRRLSSEHPRRRALLVLARVPVRLAGHPRRGGPVER